MILNSKQLEELESFSDVVAEFDEDRGGGGDTESFDDSGESAFAWRRGMLEKAIANVKKASQKFAEPGENLPVGSLFYDQGTKRFARVLDIRTGKLHVAYVSGGESDVEIRKATKQEQDEAKALTAPKQKAEKTAPAAKKAKGKAEKAEKKAAKSAKIEEKANEEPKAKKLPTVTSKIKAQPEAKKAKGKVSVGKASRSTTKKAVSGSSLKKPVAKKKPKAKAMSMGLVGEVFDPIADPNSYIREHFKLMSNRQLAEVTGLSEHTIRRKLGEWGLKRVA